MVITAQLDGEVHPGPSIRILSVPLNVATQVMLDPPPVVPHPSSSNASAAPPELAYKVISVSQPASQVEKVYVSPDTTDNLAYLPALIQALVSGTPCAARDSTPP
jgi:hypothetical protein